MHADDAMSDRAHSDLIAIEKLLDASGWCSDHDKYTHVISLAQEIMSPHIQARAPKALWLSARMPICTEASELSDEEFDAMWQELVCEAATGGRAEAQYRHGCNLYEKGRYEEALKFYELAALQDYAPAQWCFGIDTLYGTGVPQDIQKGLRFIRKSADRHCENAITFMINSLKDKKHGFSADAEEIQRWEDLLAYVERNG